MVRSTSQWFDVRAGERASSAAMSCGACWRDWYILASPKRQGRCRSVLGFDNEYARVDTVRNV
jgi:hypothetical protein